MNTGNKVSSPFKRILWYVLLLIPFIGALWVPFYNRIDPALFGIPFFYWFQFVWIIVTAVITAGAYLARL
ncbi:MAG TPA: DUF3311 domain-containing protein [Gammaproteobacteria bacterium]|nr:DUF3311 domain-containing protein [Gammaproteobacteria bacterium]